MIVDKLVQFGLSEKEAQTYETLASFGTAIVSDIAQKSGINRSTTYVIVESLAKRGLVSASQHGGVRKYSIATPDSFTQIAKDSLKTYEGLVKIGEELAKEIKAVSEKENTSLNEADILTFKGAKGLKAVYEDIFRQKNTVRIFSGQDNLENSYVTFINNLVSDHSKLAQQIKVVVPDSATMRESIVADNSHGEFFLISAPPSRADFIVFGNKIAIISTEPIHITVIENASSAGLFSIFFDLLSQNATRWNVKREAKRSGGKAQTKHPALVKAEKRFWKI